MDTRDTAARLAVELWKILRAFDSALTYIPPDRQPRLAAQLRFTRGRLDSLLAEAGLTLRSFEGQAYSPSLPATAVNADEVDGAAALLVTQTIEPSIVADGQVLLTGKVIIGTIETNQE
jgi:hypothetical protein